MSASGGIKRQILENRRLGNPHYSNAARDHPRTEIIRSELRKEAASDMGFQCFPGSEQAPGFSNKRKRSALSLTERILAPGGGGDEDVMELNEDKEEGETAWKGPDLNKPYDVQNLDSVIKSLKAPNVLFDGGETKIGKKSQNNLFKWIEEFSRIEHKKKKEADNQTLL